jgi:hypothetical protein
MSRSTDTLSILTAAAAGLAALWHVACLAEAATGVAVERTAAAHCAAAVVDATALPSLATGRTADRPARVPA